MKLVVQFFRCCSGILAETEGAGGLKMGTRTRKDELRSDVGAGGGSGSGQERSPVVTAKSSF